MDSDRIPHFTRQHHNAIAKEIREVFPIDLAPMTPQYDELRSNNLERRTALTNLAFNLTKRFQADNPNFEPKMFLDACSPNTDLYPLSELWEA